MSLRSEWRVMMKEQTKYYYKVESGGQPVPECTRAEASGALPDYLQKKLKGDGEKQLTECHVTRSGLCLKIDTELLVQEEGSANAVLSKPYTGTITSATSMLSALKTVSETESFT